MWTTLFLLTLFFQMGPELSAPPVSPRVPIGYAPAPQGTPLRLVGRPWIDGPGFRMTVTNGGSRTIVGLRRYVALLERWPWPFSQPVTPFEHDFGTMALQPGQTVTLSTPWLNAREIDELLATASDRLQMFLAPSWIRFGDGDEWTQSLDLEATDHMAALGRRPTAPANGR